MKSYRLHFKFLMLVLTFVTLGFCSCSKNDVDPESTFGIFTVMDDNTVEMNGAIGDETLSNFDSMIEKFPDINRIEMNDVPGSDNDEINLMVSKKVHDRNIATHLMNDGHIASGGVDFFLAGTTRTKGSNTQIGVHSWKEGSSQATDFPVGDEKHLEYIQYYVSIGFTQTEAEDFYYFTINAAEASDIHYMTDAEIDEYKILKP